jgi:hypothetical protein
MREFSGTFWLSLHSFHILVTFHKHILKYPSIAHVQTTITTFKASIGFKNASKINVIPSTKFNH